MKFSLIDGGRNYPSKQGNSDPERQASPVFSHLCVLALNLQICLLYLGHPH